MTVFEDINKETPTWDILGYINDMGEIGNQHAGYSIVGNSESIPHFIEQGVHLHYTYHLNAKKKQERIEFLEGLMIPDELLATGIHPRAYINPTSVIGPGSLILPNAATSANARVGRCVHVYTNGFIGHDSDIGDYSTVAAHAVVGARIKAEKGVHIGLNSTIREDVAIGKYAIVGMSATVLKDIPENGVAVGNPARLIG